MRQPPGLLGKESHALGQLGAVTDQYARRVIEGMRAKVPVDHMPVVEYTVDKMLFNFR